MERMVRERKAVLEMRGISKNYGGVHALSDARLDIEPGEVHALMGENGAGKSTLMKILTGTVKADGGTIRLNGETVHITHPYDAIRLGISIVNQELNPQPYMTVAENIFLFREHTHRYIGLLDEKRTNREAQRILDSFGFQIDARTKMQELSIAQMQMIEIIRAVVFDAKIIILDEPTSSLTSREVGILFRIVKELRSKGISIVYISHRLEEIFEICDRITIFRDGRYVGTHMVRDMDNDKLIFMMAGDIAKLTKVDVPLGETVLEVKNLTGNGFEDVSFSLRKGEILGFYGLVGSGRSETMRAIFGVDSYAGGEIALKGKPLRVKSARCAIKNGIAMVPEDRKICGLMLNRSIRENSSLASLYKTQKRLLIKESREKAAVVDVLRELQLKASSIEAEASSLSGGNQQKVVISKWLMTNPQILILDEPTRGIDVGAKAQIHKIVNDFAAQGMAVILISSELPEIMGLSDRLLVYYEGRVQAQFSRKQFADAETAKSQILLKAFGQ